MAILGAFKLFIPSTGRTRKPGRAARLTLAKAALIAVALCGAIAIVALAQTPSTFLKLADFDGTDGAFPQAPLVQTADGKFFGTAGTGGDNGSGTVFVMTADGTLNIIHIFAGGVYASGNAGLVSNGNGEFYDTTLNGGADGFGSVFTITAGGPFNTIHSFPSSATPSGGLLLATDGNFYGTTVVGGDNNDGRVFRVTPDGSVTTMHSFDGTDGINPYGALIQAADGSLYGTTNQGGAHNGGTVFKMTLDGATFKTLHSFSLEDGEAPWVGVIQGTDGKFYGVTSCCGGANGSGSGTVFQMAADGTLIVLHVFIGTDGNEPAAALVQASNGAFYGTTFVGGTNNRGTLFKITTDAILTTLHNFDTNGGIFPISALIQAADGNLYGTTSAGGADGFGTVYRIAP